MKLKYLLFALFIVLILIFIGKQVFHKERIPIYIIQENAIDSLYQNTAEESMLLVQTKTLHTSQVSTLKTSNSPHT